MSICGIAQAGHLSTLDRLLIFICAGLWLGQVSNSNAHELFHRSSSGPRQLGVAIYCSLLFGHYASAHPKVHYVYVATDRDPNSAQSGEGFYRFLIRAWLGGFHEGLVAKTLHLGGKASTVTLVSSLCWIHSRWGFDSFCLFGHRRVYRPRQAVGPCSRCADPVVSVR
ncbi:MAG: fatty acid desaturase [Ascidiaceihabitans sp.]